MGIRRLHLIISGKVQGVAYRISTYDKAKQLGVKGWVKNQQGGDVEIIAEGDNAALDKFVTWANIGPPHADVSNVTMTEQIATGEFVGFNIR